MVTVMLRRWQPRRGWQNIRRHAGRCSVSTISGGLDPISYCRDVVRKHDYASYLVSQFYPKDAQGGYFALKAFSVRFKLIHH
jgi:NADH dehydrogenase [ubiquinone] 1 alpha subcomplex assembly factor 6